MYTAVVCIDTSIHVCMCIHTYIDGKRDLFRRQKRPKLERLCVLMHLYMSACVCTYTHASIWVSFMPIYAHIFYMCTYISIHI